MHINKTYNPNECSYINITRTSYEYIYIHITYTKDGVEHSMSVD